MKIVLGYINKVCPEVSKESGDSTPWYFACIGNGQITAPFRKTYEEATADLQKLVAGVRFSPKMEDAEIKGKTVFKKGYNIFSKTSAVVRNVSMLSKYNANAFEE